MRYPRSPKKPNAEILNVALNRFLSPFLSQEKLTHVYIACGHLEDPQRSFEYQNFTGDFSFDLASLTKVLVTVPLLFSQIQKFGFQISQTVGECLGDKGLLFPKRLSSLTLEALVNHSSGLPAWRNFWINRIDQTFDSRSIDVRKRTDWFFEKLQKLDLTGAKDSSSLYSDVGFLTLGSFLELQSGRSLSDLFGEFCKDRLGKSDERLFFPTARPKNLQSYVPTAFCPIRDRRLVGEVHDENAFSLGGVCGHAGLFGDGKGLVEYLSALWKSEVGKGIFKGSYEFSQREKSSSLLKGSNRFINGWQESSWKFDPDARVIKHLGFTGTGIWLVPNASVYLVILTNRVYSSRLSSWIQQFREDLCENLWKEILPPLELKE